MVLQIIVQCLKSQADKRHALTGAVQVIETNTNLNQQFPIRELAKTMHLRPKTANLNNLAS